MKVLIVLNYYWPYISGVSEYARLLAEKLCKRGYEVTVLTSNHAKLKRYEEINGVKVIRADILGKISKGTISPEFIRLARKLSKEADVVNMHLPMIESSVISKSIDTEKLVVTYHCDINLPSTPLNKFITRTMDWSNNICLKKAGKIMVQTIDYSSRSRVAYKYVDKFVESATPIKDYESSIVYTGNANKPVIGFCGRLVAEKGLNVLLDAFSLIKEQIPNATLRIGGDYKSVAGGSIYPELVEQIKKKKIEDVEFVGKIPDENMADFYSSLDVFVLPSINSLEAFGMVQVEAMYCGTPVVASDLPGVRTIVRNTQMGRIATPNDANDLAVKILDVINNRSQFIKKKDDVAKLYSTNACVDIYEKAMHELRSKR
ncbi:MAG: glycosyltransferase [Lachnospiraceae bacterium]|nr:glycosyltransferase [Lachnospiraceae bacterium]